MIPERFTSAAYFENKQLHIDTSNLDYIFIVNEEIVETGCDPQLSPNSDVVMLFNELETY